jgi:hypothetical protein
MDTQPCCGNCNALNRKRVYGGYFQCRRHPPAASEVPLPWTDSKKKITWVSVQDWCGDYQKLQVVTDYKFPDDYEV